MLDTFAHVDLPVVDNSIIGCIDTPRMIASRWQYGPLAIVTILKGKILYVIKHLVATLNHAVFASQSNHDGEIPAMEVSADGFAISVALLQSHWDGWILKGDIP